MITPRRLPPVDPGLLAEQLLVLKQTHPGWHITYDTGTRVWSALRSPFPTQREIDAGIRLLIKAPSPERMDEELTRQAEILKGLTTPPQDLPTPEKPVRRLQVPLHSSPPRLTTCGPGMRARAAHSRGSRSIGEGEPLHTGRPYRPV